MINNNQNIMEENNMNKPDKRRLWETTDPFVLFPTEEDRVSAYNDMAEVNDLPLKKEDDYEVFDYCQRLAEDYWNEKFQNGATNLQEVVVTGYFGAWNGPRQIVPCRCEDLEEAVSKCCNISGDWGATLFFEEDDEGQEHLFITVSHHDGTCRYELSLLANAAEVDETDAAYKLKAISHEMVFNY